MEIGRSQMMILPGDRLPPLSKPQKSKAIRLGPGVVHVPPAEIIPSRTGEVVFDQKRNALWIESNMKRYIPAVSDSVIATVLRSSAEAYILSIPGSPNSQNVTLPHLAFENATKKTRPILQPGSVVYCRVSVANRFMEPEVECYNNQTGKADGFGELKGGMIFTISTGLARRLLGDGKKLRLLKNRQSIEKAHMSSGLEVVEELASKLSFEIAVGRNGRVWVNSADVKTTLLVGKAIADSEFLTGQEQKDMVRFRIKELSS